MKRILIFSAPLLLTIAANAAPLTPGNLAIYRVGDGSATLGTAATAVFLDEYTTLGGFVQSLALPTSGGAALTAVGNATTEGIMTFSQDGSMVVFTGYRAAVGTANPGGVAPATINRVIGRLDPVTGLFDTSIGLTDPTGTIRSATTVDGSSYYISASGNFLRYVASPGPASTSVQIDARNSRQVVLSGNRLFASNGSTAITAKVQDYGILPTGATTPTPVVTLALGDAVNGIALFDLNAGIAGDDTLYVLSTVESRLRKYSYDGTSWLDNGFVSSSAQNLTGYASGGTVNLFLTVGGTLSTLTDTSGHNSTISGSISSLTSAGSNTGFRGIVYVVPEPGTFVLFGLGLAGIPLLALRRRK